MAQQTQRRDQTDDYKARESRSAAKQPTQDVVAYLKDYARQNPEMAALWCLGIGFVLGWKLKPW